MDGCFVCADSYNSLLPWWRGVYNDCARTRGDVIEKLDAFTQNAFWNQILFGSFENGTPKTIWGYSLTKAQNIQDTLDILDRFSHVVETSNVVDIATFWSDNGNRNGQSARKPGKGKRADDEEEKEQADQGATRTLSLGIVAKLDRDDEKSGKRVVLLQRQDNTHPKSLKAIMAMQHKHYVPRFWLNSEGHIHRTWAAFDLTKTFQFADIMPDRTFAMLNVQDLASIQNTRDKEKKPQYKELIPLKKDETETDQLVQRVNGFLLFTPQPADGVVSCFCLHCCDSVGVDPWAFLKARFEGQMHFVEPEAILPEHIAECIDYLQSSLLQFFRYASTAVIESLRMGITNVMDQEVRRQQEAHVQNEDHDLNKWFDRDEYDAVAAALAVYRAKLCSLPADALMTGFICNIHFLEHDNKIKVTVEQAQYDATDVWKFDDDTATLQWRWPLSMKPLESSRRQPFSEDDDDDDDDDSD